MAQVQHDFFKDRNPIGKPRKKTHGNRGASASSVKNKYLFLGIILGMLLVLSGCQKNEIQQEVITEDQSLHNDDHGNESSADQQESSAQTVESINLEAEEDKTIDVEEFNTQASENIESEMTTEELFDLFINGSIGAISSADSTSSFYITDLDMDSDEWESYSIGEQVDLDNDGENELIICGPYGGIYFDARDNKVYEFAAGEGTGYMLSYVVYNGATWIMYSNRMHAGYELFHMEKFEGADNLVAEMNFSEELIDGNNIESGMKYTLNGMEISYDEFEKLASKICATEVTTTK